MEITLTIQQSKVYDEVSQTTAYTGVKMTDDNDALSRIRTIDADKSELVRFWNEGRTEVARELKRNLVSEDMYATEQAESPSPTGDYYKLKLDVASSLSNFGGGFNTSLQPGMQLSLFSYFVNYITTKWYMYTNKKEAAEYAKQAEALLEDLKQKVMSQTRPERPRYIN